MRITGFSIVKHVLHYPAPIRTARQIFAEREILYVYLFSGDICGTGEISPLEEFGAESLESAESGARKLCRELVEFHSGSEISLEDFYILSGKYTGFPAMLSGVEQAVLQLYTKCVSCSVKEVYGLTHIEEIEVNAMVGAGTPEETLLSCQKAWDIGYNTVKLKIGNSRLYNDLRSLSLIREHVPSKLKIRLDANGSFSKDEAMLRLKAYAPFNIEYIEQPVSSIEDFITLREHVDMGLAIDESVVGFGSIEQALQCNAIDVFVLKPAQLGLLRNLLPLVRSIESEGKGVVITHSLESRIGRKKAVIAALFCLFRSAHGLGIIETTGGLTDSSYPVDNGKITVTNAFI